MPKQPAGARSRLLGAVDTFDTFIADVTIGSPDR